MKTCYKEKGSQGEGDKHHTYRADTSGARSAARTMVLVWRLPVAVLGHMFKDTLKARTQNRTKNFWNFNPRGEGRKIRKIEGL